MPRYRYDGKAPMRVGAAKIGAGDIVEADSNPEPKLFTEIDIPVVAEAPPKQAKGRKPEAVTNEEASDGN